ncbi:flagellar basal body P-ring protein FlgI [Tundrisphaera lichenicola]|uniref:flagellar basal body P-ring protein FlgI n=1 Tax=Tundrisphaera lichenicola TaxID=2029860 RepID=UPI003EB9D326
MRRILSSRARVLGTMVAGAALILTGAGKGKPPLKDVPPPKVDETVGDVASIIGADLMVEGVGLVIGLEGTGSEPAPSAQTTKLLDEMKKSGVEHPERMFQSSNASIVIVRAHFPAGLTTFDKFDVEIELPPASATSSLAGGWLVSTQLAQKAMTREGEKDDKVIATAGGPIMVGTNSRPNDPKFGQVLGGGRGKEDSPYLISIKESRRSGKTSKLLEDRIKERFHQVEGSDRKGMAIARTDSALVLKVPRIYHHNQDRYHLIIKYLSLVDNPALREQRLARWGKELIDPKKSGIAAIKLEGIGPNAIPTLKAGLSATDETCRFFAAEALAYLNEGDSAAVLADVARKKPEFRSFALKAMASMNDSASLIQLRKLMAEPDYELRYGAFDALRTLDPTDPFLGKNQVLEDLPEPEPVDDMAIRSGSITFRKPKPRREEPFALYVVDCEGPPMIHVSRSLRCEIVVFGRDQRLLTPIVLGAGGPLLLNASDGDEQVQICKINSKTLDAPESKVNSPLEVAEIIRVMANLGASYPDIATVLGAASIQKNLVGPFVIDALPAPNKAYDEAQLASETSKKDEELKKTGLNEKRSSIRERFKNLFNRENR